MDKLIRNRIHKMKINNSKKDNKLEEYSDEFNENNLFTVTDLIKNELGINNNSITRNNSKKEIFINNDNNLGDKFDFLIN